MPFKFNEQSNNTVRCEHKPSSTTLEILPITFVMHYVLFTKTRIFESWICACLGSIFNSRTSLLISAVLPVIWKLVGCETLWASNIRVFAVLSVKQFVRSKQTIRLVFQTIAAFNRSTFSFALGFQQNQNKTGRTLGFGSNRAGAPISVAPPRCIPPTPSIFSLLTSQNNWPFGGMLSIDWLSLRRSLFMCLTSPPRPAWTISSKRDNQANDSSLLNSQFHRTEDGFSGVIVTFLIIQYFG